MNKILQDHFRLISVDYTTIHPGTPMKPASQRPTHENELLRNISLTKFNLEKNIDYLKRQRNIKVKTGDPKGKEIGFIDPENKRLTS